MISRSLRNRSNSNSFWQQLEQDIDDIGKRAKDNLKKYERSQYKQIKKPQKPSTTLEPKPDDAMTKVLPVTINTEKKPLVKQFYTRNQLYKRKNNEKIKQIQLTNRMAYFSKEKQKKSKTIELAKKKFSEIIQIRNESFHEKALIKKVIDIVNQRKKSLVLEYEKEAKVKAEEVKSARSVRNKTVRNWHQTIQLSAKKLREQTKKNQSRIKGEKKQAFEEKRQKAKKTKITLEKSRAKLSQISLKRKEMGRDIFLQKRSEQFRSLEAQKKVNKSLLEKLKKETESINKYRSRAERQILSYQQFLNKSGTKSDKQNKQTRIPRAESSHSFMVTTLANY